MANRRDFLKECAAASAGLMFMEPRCASAAAGAQTAAPGKRWEVMVGGQRVRTIDMHTHVFAPEAAALLKDRSLEMLTHRVVQFEDERTLRDLSPYNTDVRLASMDQRGIDLAVLSVNPLIYWPDRALAREVSQITHEKLAALCAKHPDRFMGLGWAPLQHPDRAAEVLDECVRKYKFPGVAVGGVVNKPRTAFEPLYELSDRALDPFWAKAQELGALVTIHPQKWVHPRWNDENGFDNIIGHPLEEALALSHLIFHGTLDRFPKLKILIVHAGGYLPAYVSRSDRFATGLSRDERRPKRLPSEYLKEMYYDALTFSNEGLRHLIAEVGLSQIVLGTDHGGGPASSRGWSAGAVELILNAPMLSDADRRAILNGNATRLLGLRT